MDPFSFRPRFHMRFCCRCCYCSSFCSFVVVFAVVIIIPFITDCHYHRNCSCFKATKNGVGIIQLHILYTYIRTYILGEWLRACKKRICKFKYILLNARHTLVVALAHRAHPPSYTQEKKTLWNVLECMQII